MQDRATDGLRILEVDCGRPYQPYAATTRRANAQLNQLAYVAFERADWADLDDTLGVFDLIVGNHLLCEPDHVALFSPFNNRHLVTNGEMIRVDPKRGHQHQFTRAIEQIGYHLTEIKRPEPSRNGQPNLLSSFITSSAQTR
jgi:hypothetical protein